MKRFAEPTSFVATALALAGVCVLLELPLTICAFSAALGALVLPCFRLYQIREESRRSIEQNRDFVQRLLNVIPEPVYVKDAAGRYQMINEAFARQRGTTMADVLGKSAADLVDAITARAVADEDAAVLRGVSIYKEDAHPDPRTGKPRWRIVTKGACLDLAGHPVIIGANFDITPMRQAELALHQALVQQTARAERNHAFIQHLIDVVPYPFYVKDAEYRYRIVNDAFAKEWGRTKEAVLGQRLVDLTADAVLGQRVETEDQAVLGGKIFRKEEGTLHPLTGQLRFQRVVKGSCTDSEGSAVIVGLNIDITELRISELHLREALDKQTRSQLATSDFVQRVLDLIPYPVYVKDAQSRYMLVNEALARDNFAAREELIGQLGLSPGISPEALAQHFDEEGRILAGERILREEHLRHPHTGRDTYRFIAKGTCLDAHDEPVIVGAHIDLTDLRLAEHELRASLDREVQLRERTQEFIQRLIDVIPDPVYLKKSGGRYVLVNDAFADYHGHTKQEIVDAEEPPPELGQTDRRKLSLAEDEAVLQGETVLKEERTIRKLTGEEVFRVVCKRACTYVDGEPVVVGIDHHITQWRLAERELNRLAQEDALTGIANRRHFRSCADNALADIRTTGEPLAILLIDIDHFKAINDEYGHQTGDEVLVKLVKRSRELLRGDDVAGRWGGEEFVYLLPHADIEEALQVAWRVCRAFAENPILTASGAIPVRISGGVAQWRTDESLDSLIQRADQALYRAKHEGRNRICAAD